MINVEMWAIKDTSTDKMITTKFGRSLWKRKVSPNSVNIPGYRRYNWDTSTQPWTQIECPKYKMLKPVKVRVVEVEE